MTRLALPLLALLTLAACKIERTAAETTVAEDPIAALAQSTFASQLVPHLNDRATPVADLRAAFAQGIDAAGEALGNRGAGAGAAWNFAVRGEGVIIAATLDSRARKLEVDTDADGAADVTLQIGPVITGTALRDVAPFYSFGDFRDQIEFARLGRALNELASAGIVLPEGDPTGRTVTFVGATALRSADEAMVVAVTQVTVAP
jgi:predicted lipoprotein